MTTTEESRGQLIQEKNKSQSFDFNKLSKTQKVLGVAILAFIFLSTLLPEFWIAAGRVTGWIMWAWWLIWVIQTIASYRDTRREGALNPVWKKYNASNMFVFKIVKNVLEEATYSYGSWKVSPNAQSNRIIADFSEVSEILGEKKKMAVRLIANIDVVDRGTASVLKLKFIEKSDGREHESYKMIQELVEAIDDRLGEGEAVTKPLLAQIQDPPNPPKALIILTVFTFCMALLQQAYIEVQKLDKQLGLPTSGGPTTTQQSSPDQITTQDGNTEEQYTEVTVMEGGRQKTYEIPIPPGQSKEEARNNFRKQHKEDEENRYCRLKQELGQDQDNNNDGNSSVTVNGGDTFSVTRPMPQSNAPGIPDLSGQQGVPRSGLPLRPLGGVH